MRAGLLEGHVAWPGFYRRSATGLAARGSVADSRQLHSKDRHSATGLMARNKGQRGLDFTLAFCLAKKSGRTVTSHPAGVEYVPR